MIHTSKTNAGSLTRGDLILDEGKQFRLAANPEVRSGLANLRVVDTDGHDHAWIRGVNQPMDRVVGARSSGVA